MKNIHFDYQKSRTHSKGILYNDLPKAFLKSLIRNKVKPCYLQLDGTYYKLLDIRVFEISRVNYLKYTVSGWDLVITLTSNVFEITVFEISSSTVYNLSTNNIQIVISIYLFFQDLQKLHRSPKQNTLT